MFTFNDFVPFICIDSLRQALIALRVPAKLASEVSLTAARGELNFLMLSGVALPKAVVQAQTASTDEVLYLSSSRYTLYIDFDFKTCVYTSEKMSPGLPGEATALEGIKATKLGFGGFLSFLQQSSVVLEALFYEV